MEGPNLTPVSGTTHTQPAVTKPPLKKSDKATVTQANIAQATAQDVSITTELLNTARGWNTAREISDKRAWKKAIELPAEKGTVMVTRQAVSDIDRQPVIIGDRLYATTRKDEGKAARLTEDQVKQRRLDLLQAVQGLFQGEIDNDRAGEILSLLCSQSILAPLEVAAAEEYCKDKNGVVVGVLRPDDTQPVVHAVHVDSDSNELVFTTVMHYKTMAKNPTLAKQFKEEHITSSVEIRIPKRAIVDQSMERLSAENCKIDYNIQRKG